MTTSVNYFGSLGSNADEALAVVEPIVSDILKSHENGDYDLFSSLITQNLKAKVKPEGFKKAVQENQPTLGIMQSKRFVAALNKGGNPMFLWVARFSKADDDVLINITFTDDKASPKVDWVWIE
ncbi:MAG: hypothetical protein MI864_03490 [Pseudomonadales bacterium]|nr:hypothetical protein [Pseudomonadales bacterium]